MIRAKLWDLQLVKPDAATEREWQRYRGWTIKILADLEYSGGKTTASIADGVGHRNAVVKVLLYRMHHTGLVERIERWGWRITQSGLLLLLLQSGNSRLTHGEQSVNTRVTQAPSELAPSCFHAPTCHIKRICQEKTYSLKNRKLCADCIWPGNDAAGKILPRLEMQVGVPA